MKKFVKDAILGSSLLFLITYVNSLEFMKLPTLPEPYSYWSYWIVIPVLLGLIFWAREK